MQSAVINQGDSVEVAATTGKLALRTTLSKSAQTFRKARFNRLIDELIANKVRYYRGVRFYTYIKATTNRGFYRLWRIRALATCSIISNFY